MVVISRISCSAAIRKKMEVEIQNKIKKKEKKKKIEGSAPLFYSELSA